MNIKACLIATAILLPGVASANDTPKTTVTPKSDTVKTTQTAKLSDDEKDELKELEQSQKDVAELFEQLLPLFQQRGPEVP